MEVKRKTKKKTAKEPEEDWMETLSSLTDLTFALNKFVSDKIDLVKCEEDLLKGFFKDFKTYMIKTQEMLVAEVASEEALKINKVIYALCKFIAPLFNEDKFLKSLLAMSFTGFINRMLIHPKLEFRVKELACSFLINHVKATLIHDHLEEAILILDYLLGLSLDPKKKTQSEINGYVNRMLELKEFMRCVNFLGAPMGKIREKLFSCIFSKMFLKCKNGPVWLGLILSRDQTRIKAMQEKIRDFISTLNKKEAAAFGDVYFHAYSLADEDVKQEIEESCIQDLMQKIFILKRNGLEMGKTGQLVFSILQRLHHLRTSKKFSEVITKLYTPLIWRSLRASNPAERCNAAEVFMDVFPLEKSKAVENANFRDRQIKEVKDLLLDECHIVRIIAIKGTCFHLSNSFPILTLQDIKELYTILADKLANDGSTYLVRKAVFDGFSSMLDYRANHEILFTVVSSMHLHIHDENEHVRKAFVKFLQKIGSIEGDHSCWDIVPVEHAVIRLVEEGPLVGVELVKLIMPDFYNQNQSIDKTIKKIRNIIKIHEKALVCLFKHSKTVLDTSDAYTLIVTIIGVLRKITKEFFDNPESENVDPEAQNNTSRPNNKRKKVLKNISNIDSEENDSTVQNPEEISTTTANKITLFKNIALLKDHSLVMAMMSAVTHLWGIFSPELNENNKYINDLYSLSSCTIPMLLRYYKGTPVYYSIVDFASLIPISKLTPVSTIASACISELKQMTDETPPNITQLLVFALSSWDRAGEIVDLITEWLNHSFRQENLNLTLDMQKAGKKTKVRFEPLEGKPLHALTLLKYIINDMYNLKRALLKRYDRLHGLHSYMARIKIVLEKRLVTGKKFKEKELSDQFITECFKYYVELGVHLHRPEKPPEYEPELTPMMAPNFLNEVIEYARNSIVPFLPKEPNEDDLSIDCINNILEMSNFIISISHTNTEYTTNYAAFVSILLSTDCAIYFLYNISRCMEELCQYSKSYLPNDDWSLFKTILPCLQGRLIEVVVASELTSTNIKKYVQDITGFKRSFFSPLMAIYSHYKHDDLFKEIYANYIYSIIQMICKQIIKESTIICEKDLNSHQFMVQTILKFMLGKPLLLKRLFIVLNEHVTMYKTEGINLLSCVSLIYTLTHVFKAKMLSRYDNDIEICLKNAFNCLNSYEQNVNQSEDDSFYNSEMDIKKLGLAVLKEAADQTSFTFALNTTNTPRK